MATGNYIDISIGGSGGGSGTPGGSDTQVQFNDSSAFGGDAGLTYNKTTNVLSLSDALAIGTTPATTGTLRFAKNATAMARNDGNTADLYLWEHPATTNSLWIGTDQNTTSGAQFTDTHLWASSYVSIGTLSSTVARFDANVGIQAYNSILTIGTSAATAGNIRLPSNSTITARNSGNTADLSVVASTAANSVYVGDSTGGTNNAALFADTYVMLRGTGGTLIGNVAGTYKFEVGVTSTAQSSYPILGGTGLGFADASPYGVHGVGLQIMADANQTPSAQVYCYHTIATTGAITANRNLTLPAATDAAGYTKIIDNRCTGAFSIIVKDSGAGTTVTVANGSIITVLMDSRGATQVGVAVAGSGSFTAPTGTGLMKVTTGTMDVASSLLLNADVNAAAAIAGTKISPDFGSQNVVTTGILSAGATPAAAGTIRIPNASEINARNVGGTADITMAMLSSSNRLYLGFNAAFGQQATSVWQFASTDVTLGIGSTTYLTLTANTVGAQKPIIGDASPYALNGVGTQAMADANQTPALAVYKYNTIATTGAITANRNLTLPAATDAAAYTKIIDNRCTGAFSVIVGDGGAGTTVTVANGSIVTVLMDSRGATKVGVASASGSGTPGGSDTQIQFNDASAFGGDAGLTYNKTTNVLSISDALAIGATPSTTGSFRGPSTGDIKFRNAGNSADVNALAWVSGTSLTLGSSTGAENVYLRTGSSGYTRIFTGAAGNFALTANETNIMIGFPIIGDSGQPSPYGVHGVGTQAMADANQTPAAGVYCYNTIATTGAITANRNLTLPAATDAAAYTKIIDNRCTGAFSIIVKDSGAGTTVTVPNGTIVTVLMDSRGATQVGVVGGTGVATFLGTPTSANLAAAVTDETGSGALVFGTAPTISSPVLSGTPNISAATAITSGNAKGVETDRYPVNVQTTDATVTTLDSFTLASGTMVACSWMVTCIQSTSATAGAWSVTACFRNNAGTVSQVGTSQVSVLGTDDAAYTCTIDNSTTTIRLRVTGKAATTLQWTGVATCLTVIP